MDSGIPELIDRIQSMLQLDRLPELAVLLIGVLVGLVGKNLYTLIKNILGFAGSFLGRMAFGFWQDIRRETPNIVDGALGVVTSVEGRRVLVMDPLLGSLALSSVYLNPRTAFGVRIQAFLVKRERPWVHFAASRGEGRLAKAIREWRNARRRQFGLAELLPPDSRRIKYRRVYAPLERLIGQYLTNEFALQMALGEPCYVFRFVVALVYEKNADDYIDRQFHTLVIWEETLQRAAMDGLAVYQPEFRHRAETFARIARRWREAPEEFGTIFVMVPKSMMAGDYTVEQVEGPDGERVPIHRPVVLDVAEEAVAGLIRRLGPGAEAAAGAAVTPRPPAG